MTLESKPLSRLTDEAVQILYRELGVVDTVRFLILLVMAIIRWSDANSMRRRLWTI